MSTETKKKVTDEDGYVWEGPEFSVEVVEKIDNGKGYWQSIVVGVFQQDEKDGEKKLLGTYKRNYSTNFNNFSWCRKGDRYFALYSPDYTGTRVMEILPGEGFKDIGGEERDGGGFCPTDLYIVRLKDYVSEEFHVPEKVKDWSNILENFPPGSRISERHKKSKGRQKLYYPDGHEIRAYNGKFDEHTINGVKVKRARWDRVYGPERELESVFVEFPPKHAFVAGCYWGDDTIWKIQYIDVSRIDEGIIKRDERFGYIELPPHLNLKKAVETMGLEDGGKRVSIAVSLDFDIETGEVSMYEKSLYDKIVAGRKKIEETEERWEDYNERAKKIDEELEARWKEHGDRIKQEIKDTGGKIGF